MTAADEADQYADVVDDATEWPVYDAAVAYLRTGWCPTPLKGKVPVRTGWASGVRPSTADCWTWWVEDRHDGVGVVCGAVSGGLIVIDIEGRLVVDTERMAKVLEHLRESGVLHLVADALDRASSTTPSGGRHLFFRVTGGVVPGNAKLAYKKAGTDDVLLVETRGEGGQVAAPPAPGRSWDGSSGPGQAVEVTLDELACILAAFRSIDESERLVAPPAKPRVESDFVPPANPTVADAFSLAMMAGDLAWTDVLDPGWSREGYDRQGRSQWLRPEYGGVKPTSSFSAKGFEKYVAGPVPVLVVHSAAVSHLPQGEGQRLTPGRVWAHCWFDGDEAAAYAALEKAITGDELDPRVAALPSTVLDLAAAIVAEKHPRDDGPLADDREPAPEPPPGHLDLSCLPPALRAAAHSVSEHTGSPVETCALAGLAALSAAVAGHLTVRYAWDEPMCLFTLAAGDPGERKTAVLKQMGTGPLSHAADVVDDIVAAALVRWKVTGEQLAADLDAATDTATQIRIERLIDEHKARKPVRPRFTVGDGTPEGIVDVMASHRGVAAVFSAEGTLLNVVAGGYNDNRAVAIGYLNSAWSAETISSVRRGTGRVHVEDPYLAACLVVQPAFISRLGASAMEETGFTARWIVTHPRSTVWESEAHTRPLDRDAMKRWRGRIAGILTRCWDPDRPERDALIVTEHAASVFRNYYSEILQAGKRSVGFAKQWRAKAHGQTLRVAGLFALAKDPNATAIDAATMADAVTFMRWATAETMRVVAPEVEAPGASVPIQRTLRAIRAHWDGLRTVDGQERVSRREVYRWVRQQAWVASAENVQDALVELVEKGYLEEGPVQPRQKAGSEFIVRKAVLEADV